ncbi:serine hydrolase domain-containing protein [Bacteroidota bacterium]
MKTKIFFSVKKFNHYLFLLIITFSSIYLASCDSDSTTPTDGDHLAQIKAAMNATQAEMDAPGWIAGIFSPSESYELVGGMADVDGNVAMEISSLMRIGSITKTFTATIILILVDEGKLSLDDKLEKFLPDYPKADEITVRQLTKHTSGIVSWDEDDEVRMSVFNGTKEWTIDELIDWASEEPFISEPGTEYHYSNIGYFILGKIIEQASEMTVAQAIRDKIAIPLGLQNTFMAESSQPVGDYVHGYDESSGSVEDMTGTPQAIAINYELAWTAGGMLSTLEDLHVWSKALVTGELLSDSLHEQQMPVPNPPSEANPYWSGYGIGINQTDAWFGHSGAVCGFICNMSYNPEDDVAIVTFFNKFSAFDIDANTADLTAATLNFFKLARMFCPETLKE